MKKLFLIYLLAITSIFNLAAQNDNFISNKDYSPNYAFGIKQGVNYSSVSFNPSIKQGATIGYSGGLVYKFQNEKLFAFQMELNYTQKGWNEALDTINNSYSRKLNYIELPFITQIAIGKRPKMKVFVNLGTSFGYFLSEKENAEINEELYSREYYGKEIENYFDYSVLGDLGLILNTGMGQFNVGLRYQFTLTDMFENTEETIFANSKNSLLNFSIVYFFLDNRK